MPAPAARLPIARLIEQPARGSTGSGTGRVHALGLGVHRLGRGPGVDLVVDHPDVSRVHAELEVSAEGARVRDLASKNGVRVDGRQVRSAELGDASELALGGLVLVFEHPRARVLGLLTRAGEPTLRRARAEVAGDGRARSAARRRAPGPRPSVVAPALASLVFAVLLVALLRSS